MHMPYGQGKVPRPDFKVKYSFLTYEEGGRRNLPFQGLRCDFSYEGDSISQSTIYMIHPEFLDDNDNVIVDDNTPVGKTDHAFMWILNPEMRKEVHQKRIRIGVKGFLQEGQKRIASVEVIEIIGLHENPTE